MKLFQWLKGHELVKQIVWKWLDGKNWLNLYYLKQYGLRHTVCSIHDVQVAYLWDTNLFLSDWQCNSRILTIVTPIVSYPCLYVCMYVYVYVCKYACICVCVCVCVYLQSTQFTCGQGKFPRKYRTSSHPNKNYVVLAINLAILFPNTHKYKCGTFRDLTYG